MNKNLLISLLSSLEQIISRVAKIQTGSMTILFLMKASELIQDDFKKEMATGLPEFKEFIRIMTDFQNKAKEDNKLLEQANYYSVDDTKQKSFTEYKNYWLAPFLEYQNYLKTNVLPNFPIIEYTMNKEVFIDYIADLGAIKLYAILNGNYQGLEKQVGILKKLTGAETDAEMIYTINKILNNATQA